MAILTTLLNGITGQSFRTTVNTNFDTLNTDKAETTVTDSLNTRLTTAETAITNTSTQVTSNTASIAALNSLSGSYQLFGAFVGLIAPSRNLTTVPQTLGGFSNSGARTVSVNTTTGTITPTVTAWYRVSKFLNFTYTSAAADRVLTLTLWDNTLGVVVNTINHVIPKATTSSQVCITNILPLTANHQYELRLSTDVAMTVSIDVMSYGIDIVGVSDF